MTIEKFAPRSVPFQASSTLREYLDDQMRRLQVLVNGAAQIEDDEAINGNWTFNGEINFGTDWTLYKSGNELIFEDNDDDGRFQIRDANNFTNFQVDHVDSIVDVRNGFIFRIRDAGDTDYADLYHDGTNFITDFVNTGPWLIRNLSRVQINDGARLRIQDAGDTDFADFLHNGDDFLTSFTNTDDWLVSGIDDLVLVGGVALRIDDAADNSWAVFSHDGTDFISDFTNTGDWILNNLDDFINEDGEIHAIGFKALSGGDALYSETGASSAILDLNAKPLDGTSTANVRLFRSTNTSGDCQLAVLRGNNSTAVGIILRTKGSSAAGGYIYIGESAAADASVAGRGQLWVKNTSPCQLWFTDDAGNDTQIV